MLVKSYYNTHDILLYRVWINSKVRATILSIIVNNTILHFVLL